MMQQVLFADTPRARNSDPVTSHLAAERIKATGALGKQQALVLDLVKRFPGCTSAELAHKHAWESGQDFGQWRFRIARRLGELVPVHARRGKPRMCAVNGTPATVWHPVK